jgi:hypothetical protein
MRKLQRTIEYVLSHSLAFSLSLPLKMKNGNLAWGSACQASSERTQRVSGSTCGTEKEALGLLCVLLLVPFIIADGDGGGREVPTHGHMA